MSHQLKIPVEVSRIIDTLKQGGFSAYLVGGCVRDLLLNRPPKDWDITTSAKPEQIVSLFPKTFYENHFGTVTVVDETAGVGEALKNIEITPFRLEGAYSDKRHPDSVKFSDKLEDDLQRRDFTINALALDPTKGQVVDLFGGESDLKNRTIRSVGQADERFTEDALRILRCVRLAVELGFTIADETTNSIIKNGALVREIAAERIRDELCRIIMSDNPMVGLVLCHKLMILKHFLPELEEGVHVKQNGEHIYDVWEHTLRVLQHSADKKYPLEIRLSALFHDIAKPRTRAFNQDKQNFTFYGHEVVGAKMTKIILARLKFSRETSDRVVNLVRNHMFFSDTEKITLSAVRRIIAKVGRENIDDLLKVRMCDRIGMGRPKEQPYRLRKYQSMIDEALRQPTSVGMLKVRGDDVIHETKLPPGPKIGFILSALLEEVLENPEINERELLMKRAQELANLDEKTLKELGDSGKEKIAELEEGIVDEIRKKHFVK
ncbi:HD domain-containing protein [Candidatus Nomurabacteria bacterium]|nr:HD domain-containing protein [Candidatus Nomurabacteria bacterium]